MLSQFTKVAAIAVAAMLAAVAAGAQAKSCQSAGGMLMTDLGAVDANTTMGVATGDLKGAVGATILNIESQNGGAILIFTVQHHWVSESGDIISLDPATAYRLCFVDLKDWRDVRIEDIAATLEIFWGDYSFPGAYGHLPAGAAGKGLISRYQQAGTSAPMLFAASLPISPG